MSSLTLVQQKALQQAEARARLDAANKEAARTQLLRIQILLAQRVSATKRND